jgi:PhnB protein
MPDDVKIAARTMQGGDPLCRHGREIGGGGRLLCPRLGARDLGRIAGEDDPSRLMHCQVEVNGGALMISDMHDPNAPLQRPQDFYLQLVVTDGDRWWDRASRPAAR